MPLEPPTPGSPEDWLRHARSDLALAQQWQVPDVLLAALCFHAQQTVEKSLKAVLVQRADYSSRDVSCHGDDVLAAPDRDSAGAGGSAMTMAEGHLGASYCRRSNSVSPRRAGVGHRRCVVHGRLDFVRRGGRRSDAGYQRAGAPEERV